MGQMEESDITYTVATQEAQRSPFSDLYCVRLKPPRFGGSTNTGFFVACSRGAATGLYA